MNKKVSIIIPVYNAEKLITRCLDSLINQTYKNIEVVCINDGSTDKTYAILKEYAKKYDSIYCYTQKNKGCGETRNRAFSLVTGEYITFVDADDYVEEDYIEKLISNAKNYDIVVCGYKKYDTNLNFLFKKTPKGVEEDYFTFLSTVCKLYKKTFLDKFNLKFSSRKVGSDTLFTLNCFSLTNKIKMIDYNGYWIIENAHSITRSLREKADLFEIARVVNENIDLTKFGDLSLFFYLKTVVMNLLLKAKVMNYKDYYNLYLDSFNWLDSTFKEKGKKVSFVWKKNIDFKINIVINMFIFFRKIHLIKLFLFIIQKLNIRL